MFRIGGDPVAAGLVTRLNQPGGNVTGTTTLGVELGPKRLQMLREMLPARATVALFSNPRNANAAAEAREIQAAANVLDIRLLVLNATSPSELDVVFERIAQQDIGGVLNAADPFIISQSDRIVALAERRTSPGIYSVRQFLEAGGLMFYGTDPFEMWHVVGTYVGRFLISHRDGPP